MRQSKDEIAKNTQLFLRKSIKTYNGTIIMTRPVDLDDEDGDDDSDARPAKVKLPGLVIPRISTNVGQLIISF